MENTEKQKQKLLRGFEELKAEFPELEGIEDLPAEVAEAAEKNGSLLLDEYLRYQHNERKKALSTARKAQAAALLSVGSQTDKKGGINPEAVEFLRGLWR